MKKAIAFAATLCVFQILAWLSIRHDIETLLIPPDALLPDNSVYYGELLDGRLHGKGKLLWADGSRYEGEFSEGLMSGRGELKTGRGDVYTGEFKEGMLTGQGELRCKDGTVYRGAFFNGLPHGQGELERADGSSYKGGFVQWEMHGQGIYITSGGEEYSGDFVEDKFINGTFKDAAGNRYEGGFRDWQFYGEGVYTGVDGSVLKGNFENGELNGKGSYENKEGERYEGDFKDGNYHGKGSYEDKEGERYEGDFKDGHYHGLGKLTQSDGDSYTGDFEYGLFHGKGKLVFGEPAAEQTGEWEYGEFQDPRAEEKEDLQRRLMEQALFRQGELLQAAAEKITAGTPGVIDLYFVGLAGYGQQDVFMKELHYIRELMDTRFGTTGRSALLINNPQTMEQTPLATRTGLERSLRAVAEKMNADEDILFLYLTSHGTEDHRLSISHPTIKLPSLSKAELESILKFLPVKWKVIAISACYSGGFIPPLKDENTLLMTAASAERKSFGCSDTSEITWFARAYFQESLPQAASFEQAFENARRLIAEWELKEIEKGGEHSEPQMAAGAAISGHLQKWWQSRESTGEKKK